MGNRFNDPCEQIVRNALRLAGITFLEEEDNETRLDFFIPSSDPHARKEHGVHVEVCRFYTPRKVEQCSRAENVILIQGVNAARLFANALAGKATK
jgi:hypothetical protein